MKKISLIVLLIALPFLLLGCNLSGIFDKSNSDKTVVSQSPQPQLQPPTQAQAQAQTQTQTKTYEPPKSNSNQPYGNLQVNFNGRNKTYPTVLPFDNNLDLNGGWTNVFGDSDMFFITLPSNVQAGDEFILEDGQISLSSYSLPSFSFAYKDKAGDLYSLSDANCSFDTFGLIVDKWDGRGGYIEGRFGAEIRPLVGDSIILKNGYFKVKIRN